jgi:predicted phage-related endonuclease
MFDRCIECERLGQDCVPNLLALSWPDLLDWWKKRQTYLKWSNQHLSDRSSIPLGTINRIKAGEDDCRYSTMRSIIHALMGGYSVEFPCQKKLDHEFAHYETLEKQCAELISTNECLSSQMKTIEELHKTEEANLKAALKDLEHALTDKAEAQKKIDYLLDLVAKLRTDNDNLWTENNRKSKLVDRLIEQQALIYAEKKG